MKLRVDASDLTLGELAQVGELLGMSLTDAMSGTGQARGIAAIACVVARRTDPSFSFDQALALRMSELDLVEQPDPEVPSASNGDSPRALPALGHSIPRT